MSRLRVLSSLSAFPPVTKSSSELERVGSRECRVECGVINMVGCEKPDLSDDSSLSTVSSEELDIMGSDSEERGKEYKRKGKVNDSLMCHEVNFPSDSEEGGGEGEVRDVGRGRGRRVERMVDVSVIVGGGRRGRGGSLGKVGVAGWFGGSGSGGQQRGSLNGDPTAQYHQRLGKPTLFTVPRRGDSPPVPLGGFKSTTLSRVNPGLSASLIEVNRVDGGEPRKRRPRLDASLKICSNFINDVLSKKHKGWVWPLYKPDRGKDSVFRDPIYLVDIKTKLTDRTYSRPEEFAADMRKLIGNYCRYYNSSHQYHHSAKQLQELFEQEFKKVQEMPIDGGKWVVGGGGGFSCGEVRGKRFKECVVGTSTQIPCTPVPASTPLVVSAAGIEGGVGKKGVGVAVSKLKGASLSVLVPSEGGQQVGSPVVSGSSERIVEDMDRGSERIDGGSPGVVAESMMNATLSVLKTEAKEEVRDEGLSGVKEAVKRGAGVLDTDEVSGGKRMKVDAEGGGVEDAGTTTHTIIKPVCKWIVDGFNSVPPNEQDPLLREIRVAVGIDQLDMDAVALGNLSGDHLSVVASVIVGVLTGVRVNRLKCEENGFKVAKDVITTSQTDWHKMQQDLSSIRDTTYSTLNKINHMQMYTFEALNHLHHQKNST